MSSLKLPSNQKVRSKSSPVSKSSAPQTNTTGGPAVKAAAARSLAAATAAPAGNPRPGSRPSITASAAKVGPPGNSRPGSRPLAAATTSGRGNPRPVSQPPAAITAVPAGNPLPTTPPAATAGPAGNPRATQEAPEPQIVEEYVCGLDERTQRKAVEELKEDVGTRLDSVRTLRDWVRQQNHITCPTDTRFLLAFLRVRYFSQTDARRLLENFWTRRTKFPQWFRNLDPCCPRIKAALDDGFLLLLPGRDSEGRKIFIFRPGLINVSSDAYSTRDVFRAFVLVVDYLYLVDEATSVNGTVSITDLGGVAFKHVTHLSGDERKDFLQSWQGSYPARVKQIHVYNMGPVAEVLLQLLRFCMSDKIQNRLKIHGQQLSTLYKEVPMALLPTEYLPDDYKGQHAGTRQEIIDVMKSDLTRPEVRERLLYLSSDQFGVDETMTSSGANDDLSLPESAFKELTLD